MIIDIFRLKRNKQIAEDEKLRLKITLAWWNPSEVNPAPSLGKWTKKTHFGTDFIHNTFPNWPIDKWQKKSDQTGNIVPTCLEIFEHNRARVWSIWRPSSTCKKTFAKWTNLLQIITGESLVWSIWANFPLWKKNYVVQAEIRVQSDQVRWGDMDWG